MNKLASRVIDMGETLTYTGKVDGLAPQVEEPLAAFVQESGSRMVMMVPTFETEDMVRKQGEEADRDRKKKRIKATGCIVIEQIAESEPLPQLEQRAELIADHVGAALWNARQHGRIFGLSIWKLMGTALEWFKGRKLMITTAVLAAIAVVAAALSLIKLDYPVTAEGKLMPIEQHAVFATWDGVITRDGLKVNGDEEVKKGQVLVVLENDELEAQIEEAKASVRKYEQLVIGKRAEIVQSELNVPKMSDEEKPQSLANIERMRVEQRGIEGDLEIARQQVLNLENRKKEKLTIYAQADGRIPNFQLRQLLEDRPVRQGDHLFDIMNDNGAWQMELLLQEKRMGHILRAQREATAMNKSIELPGRFTMATQPDAKFECHLTKVATRSTTDTELGTVFELNAVANEGQTLPEKRIGAEVTVKIYCGQSTLFYWCFGDVVDTAQKWLWL
jgi:multidrug efflux pump subunit AcrA (membrane-fusion protein)